MWSPDVLLTAFLPKDLWPNVKTYKMIIQRFCNEGLIGEANELFAEMEASDYLTDDRTYNTPVHNCSNNEKFNEAGVLIDEMHDNDFSADAIPTLVLLDLLV